MANKPKAKRKPAQPLNNRHLARRQSTNGEPEQPPPPPPPPKVELLAVPAALMLAAESIVAKAPKDRDDLQAIMLHLKDGIGRIVATDGTRFFIGSYAAKPVPSWLKTGILLPREGLKARVGMIAKADSRFVVMSHIKGTPDLSLADENGTMMFKLGDVAVVSTVWPYEQYIQAGSFTDMDAETAERKPHDEWEPVGFNSKHMKEVGEVANILGMALEREDRKEGTVIRSYQGGVDSPRVFSFDACDGALLIVGALRLPTRQLPLLTARVLEPATKGTLAALRAHASRWLDAAAAGTTEEAKAACMAKAEGFQQRVAAILQRAPEGTPAVAGPAPEPKADGDSGDAVEPEPQTAAEKAAETKRKRAAARAAKVLH